MGDFEDLEDGHVVLQLSAFSLVDFKASNIDKEILDVITNIERELKKFDSGEIFAATSTTGVTKGV